MKKEKAFAKKSKALVVAILVGFGGIVFWLVSTLGIALIQGDGVNQYQGVQREVAQNRLNDARAQVDNKVRYAYYWHVDEVRPTREDEKQKYCTVQEEYRQIHPSRVTNDADSVDYYTVTVSMRQVFGYSSQKIVFDGCAFNKTGSGMSGERSNLYDK